MDTDIFQPALLSMEENRFMLAHAGEPPIVALADGTPKLVNPAAVKPFLERFYELGELEKHRGVPWAGVSRIKQSIASFLEWMAVCKEIARRGGPKVPSLFVTDGNGKMFKYGIGADGGFVRSKLTGPNGEREYFAVDLRRPDGAILPDLSEIAPWMQPNKDRKPDELIEDWAKDATGSAKRNGTIRCSICGRTETFDTSNRRTYNGARARIAGHLKRATTDIDRHRILHTKSFGSTAEKH